MEIKKSPSDGVEDQEECDIDSIPPIIGILLACLVVILFLLIVYQKK